MDDDDSLILLSPIGALQSIFELPQWSETGINKKNIIICSDEIFEAARICGFIVFDADKYNSCLKEIDDNFYILVGGEEIERAASDLKIGQFQVISTNGVKWCDNGIPLGTNRYILDNKFGLFDLGLKIFGNFIMDSSRERFNYISAKAELIVKKILFKMNREIERPKIYFSCNSRKIPLAMEAIKWFRYIDYRADLDNFRNIPNSFVFCLDGKFFHSCIASFYISQNEPKKREYYSISIVLQNLLEVSIFIKLVVCHLAFYDYRDL